MCKLDYNGITVFDRFQKQTMDQFIIVVVMTMIKVNYNYNKKSPRILWGIFLKVYNFDSFVPRRMSDPATR